MLTEQGEDYQVDKHVRRTAQAHAARSSSLHRDPPLHRTLETMHPPGSDHINSVIVLLKTKAVIVSKTITALVFGTLCYEAGDWQRVHAPPPPRLVAGVTHRTPYTRHHCGVVGLW